MQHLKRDALARFFSNQSPLSEIEGIEWHLGNCPVCHDEIVARQLAEIAKDARATRSSAISGAEGNPLTAKA